jgi:hypothetical protein
MAERILVEKIQAAVGKAVQDALTESVMRHGPIICGFVAPDSLPIKEAQAIADATAKAVGPNAQAVVQQVSEGGGASGAGKSGAAALPGRVILTGIRFDKNVLK